MALSTTLLLSWSISTAVARRWIATRGACWHASPSVAGPDDGGDDLFCHVSQIEDGNALAAGTVVHYVKQYDAAKGKDRAAQLVGGIREDRRRRNGGFGSGGQRR